MTGPQVPPATTQQCSPFSCQHLCGPTRMKQVSASGHHPAVLANLSSSSVALHNGGPIGSEMPLPTFECSLICCPVAPWRRGAVVLCTSGPSLASSAAMRVHYFGQAGQLPLSNTCYSVVQQCSSALLRSHSNEGVHCFSLSAQQCSPFCRPAPSYEGGHCLCPLSSNARHSVVQHCSSAAVQATMVGPLE